jgi:hypothetical protein
MWVPSSCAISRPRTLRGAARLLGPAVLTLLGLALAIPAGAASSPQPTPEPVLSFQLVKTLPAGASLSSEEAVRLLGLEDFPAAQRRAVLDQVWIYTTPEIAIVVPRSVRGPGFAVGLPFQVFNRTADALEIRWNESQFLDGRGNAKLCHLGMNVNHPTAERPNLLNATILPSSLPPALFFKTHVFPITDFDFQQGIARFAPQPGQVALYLVVAGPKGQTRGYSLQGNLRLAAGALRPPVTPTPDIP